MKLHSHNRNDLALYEPQLHVFQSELNVICSTTESLQCINVSRQYVYILLPFFYMDLLNAAGHFTFKPFYILQEYLIQYLLQ